MSTRLAFQTQLASIMEVLANAAVAEICKLVDDDYAVVSLQMSQCQRENKALKRKLHLLELKMARGSAERRLRESALNSSRPSSRAHVNITDKYRGPPTSSGSVFDRQMNMGLWPDGSSTSNPISEPMHPVPLRQDETVDVQLVEEVKEERMDDALAETDHIALIGEDGVVECGPRGGARPSPPELPPASAPGAQPLPQPPPHPGPRTRTQASGRARGLEGAGAEPPGEEEPDVLLIKVEDLEEGLRTAGQGGLSIQEGLVESSTDDYRAAIPLDDGLALANQLAEPEGTRRSLSEVSYGHQALSYDASSANQMWSGNGNSCGDNDCVVVPGTSSLAPGFPPAPPAMRAGLSTGLEAQGGRGFPMEHSGSFPAALSVAGALGGFLGPMAGSDQGQGQGGQERYTNGRKKAERKRLYLCRFCGKGFSAPANLEPHLRTHTGERPYGCSVCGKHFSQVWNLKIHMNVHTGERPYPCPHCPERFADPSNLKKHQKRHHPAAPDLNQNQNQDQHQHQNQDQKQQPQLIL